MLGTDRGSSVSVGCTDLERGFEPVWEHTLATRGTVEGDLLKARLLQKGWFGKTVTIGSGSCVISADRIEMGDGEENILLYTPAGQFAGALMVALHFPQYRKPKSQGRTVMLPGDSLSDGIREATRDRDISKETRYEHAAKEELILQQYWYRKPARRQCTLCMCGVRAVARCWAGV